MCHRVSGRDGNTSIPDDDSRMSRSVESSEGSQAFSVPERLGGKKKKVKMGGGESNESGREAETRLPSSRGGDRIIEKSGN